MKRNIAIVAGGDTSEIVVSLRSAQGIYSFIDKEKYNLYIVEMEGRRWEVQLPDGNKVPVDRNDFSFTNGTEKVVFDFAYITSHGTRGEGGRLQGYFDMLRIPYETKALDDAFEIRVEDYYGENGGVIFPNPNAPTGILMPLDKIEDIIAHNRDVIVVVDEAYIDFGGVSALPLIEKYDNLLVVQTFSKSRSLAGMRLGFAMGNEKLIRYINDVKYSFNSYTMNQTALALGVEAIKDKAYFEETRQRVIATREWTKQELTKLGFSFGDSMSNFIFATHERVPAKELFEALKKEHIFVRYFSKERISNYLRISIGTKEEMEELIRFLKNYLQ